MRLRLTSLATLSLFGSIAGAVLLSPTAAAQDPVIVETRVPISGVTSDPCTGDSIMFTEVLHTKEQMFTSGAQIHYALEVNTENAKAQSVLGDAAYVLSTQFTSVTNANSDFAPYEVLYEEDDIVNRLGAGVADDFRMKFLFKVTINARGATTAVNLDVRAECL